MDGSWNANSILCFIFCSIGLLPDQRQRNNQTEIVCLYALIWKSKGLSLVYSLSVFCFFVCFGSFQRKLKRTGSIVCSSVCINILQNIVGKRLEWSGFSWCWLVLGRGLSSEAVEGRWKIEGGQKAREGPEKKAERPASQGKDLKCDPWCQFRLFQ